jgi:hypothetical protein
MPKFLSELASGLKTPSRKESAAYAYLIEVLDILGGLIFVAGSVCFLPKYAEDVDVFVVGCNLFVVGSVQYVIVCCLTLAEALNEKGTWTFEAIENFGWVVGSFVFLIGTILYFPDRDACAKGVSGNFKTSEAEEKCHSLAQHMNKHDKAFWGTVLFIAGSMIFVIAVFINAMNQRKFIKWHHRMVSIVSFNYMIGSLLFCMGSIAFLPNAGCGPEMVSLGAWMFIIGSGFFVVAGIASIIRTYYMLKEDFDEGSSEEDASFDNSKLVDGDTAAVTKG